MKLLKGCLLGMLWVGSALAAITTSPGMQRKQIGENCVFQWTVTGAITSHEVFNHSSGSKESLGANGSYTYDRVKGLVSLTIWNVQLWDAGNYSLSVNTGTFTTINSGALLFVYSSSNTAVLQANTTLPAYEGSSIALNCIVTSTSRPPSYRPPLEYIWTVAGIDLVSTPNGPAKTISGVEIPRHIFQDDGTSIVIFPLQREDIRSYTCRGKEQGSSFSSTISSVGLQLYHSPYVVEITPPSKKFNVDLGESVILRVKYSGQNPVGTSDPTYPVGGQYRVAWTFTNSEGLSMDLPEHQVTNPLELSTITFSLISESHYGQYHYTISNTLGTISGFFNVLRTEPPDAPANLSTVYVTSSKIALKWRCMWGNGRQQTIFTELKDTSSNTIVETLNASLSLDCYTQSLSQTFEKDIRADRNYEVSLWSNNSLGLSDIVKLNVRTPKRFRLVVSSKFIVIDNNTAVISFRVLHARMTRLVVTCCSESTGMCETSKSFKVNETTEKIVYANLPKWDVYLFDFKASDVGDAMVGEYVLGVVKGVRVSTLNDDETDGTYVAVTVLAVLFVICLLGLIGCLVAFVYITKLRGKIQLFKKEPILPTLEEQPKPKPKSEKRSKPAPPTRPLPDPKRVTKSKPIQEEEGEMYEAMETSKDKETEQETYTPLEQPPRSRQKRNLYC